MLTTVVKKEGHCNGTLGCILLLRFSWTMQVAIPYFLCKPGARTKNGNNVSKTVSFCLNIMAFLSPIVHHDVIMRIYRVYLVLLALRTLQCFDGTISQPK